MLSDSAAHYMKSSLGNLEFNRPHYQELQFELLSADMRSWQRLIRRDDKRLNALYHKGARHCLGEEKFWWILLCYKRQIPR